MHILIVGAGAMGCLFAARLAAKARVTLVDVDRVRLDALSRHGIELNDDAGDRHVRVDAMLATDVTEPADLIIIFTKGMHSAAAARSVAHAARSGTWILTLQNGLGNAEAMADIFGAESVLMGVTDHPADFKAPNRVASHGDGLIKLGAMVSSEESEKASQALCALLRQCRLEASYDSHVRGAIWEKVAFNAALNSIAAITGLPVGGIDCPEGRRIAHAVMTEVAATAAALQIAVDTDAIWGKVEFALAHHRGHQPSMLQDRLAGRATEIETINGAVVRYAERAGVAVPVTTMLADLVRMTEASRVLQ